MLTVTGVKKSKKKLALTIAACTLSLTLAFGGTLAYLIDTEGTANTVTVGKVHIELEEPGYPGNDSDEVKNIIPNQEIVKDPQIENTGNNDALVFLRVEVPQEMFTDEDDGTGEQKKQDLFRLKGISDQWELMKTEAVAGEDGKTKTSYVYGYKKSLAKGSTTDKLFQKVQMKNAVESDLSGNVEDIIVTACAIQATDIPDINLTSGNDGNLSKNVLEQVYTIFLNQSGNQASRPADEGDRNQSGKLGKISYELDGGTLAAGTLTEYGSADYGYAPPAPAKKGYKFTGWSPANIPANSTGNITFTAQWKENSAELLDSKSINVKMKKLAGTGSAKYYTKDAAITAIQRTDEEPTEVVMADANSLISTNASAKPVYAWFENGVIKWWSEAEYVNAGVSLSYLCCNMSNLSDISGLASWHVDNATNMESLFNRCTNLADLSPLTNWNTGNITNMMALFYGCTNLADLSPLTNWNTGNVTNMTGLFCNCTSLTDLSSLSNWNTENATNMDRTFGGCTSLMNLTGLENWNTANVTNMPEMFGACKQLINLTPLASWQTEKVTDMHGMFEGCANLTDLAGIAEWNMKNVTTIYAMFTECTNLADLTPLANWDMSSATNINTMFGKCTSLVSLAGLENWDTANVTIMNALFEDCTSLTDISPLANWNVHNVIYMRSVFNGCTNLAKLNGLTRWNIGKALMDSMFANCTNLSDLTPLTDWNTEEVTDISSMFYNCENLTDLSPLAKWNTGNVTDMGEMFEKCTNLTIITPLMNWDTSNVISMISMFEKCSKISDLSPLANWNVGNVKTTYRMFYWCYSLEDLTPLTNWDVGKVTDMRDMFYNCNKLANISAVNDWNITNVSAANFKYMFRYCSSYPEFTKRSGTWDSNGTFTPTT